MTRTGFSETPQRLFVVGTSGSGKTTLARAIAERLDVSHVELDSLWWEPNWTEVGRDRFHARVREALGGESWVVCGNAWTLAQVSILPRVEVVVWIDLPWWQVMRQVTVRTLRQLVTREELHGGNRQTLRTAFSKSGIIWWSLTTFSKRRRRYRDMQNNPKFAHIEIVHLKSLQAASEWLGRL